jgi:hypothetical protein
MWLPPNLPIGGELKYSKAPTIGVWVLIGITLLSCSIFQLTPSYWQTLAWGAAIIIVGSAGPQLLPKCRRNRWLRWLRAVSIGVVIASGTLVSTYGWNERSSCLRDRGLLVAVVIEWRVNSQNLDMIAGIANGIRESKYELAGAFPPLSAHDIRTAVSQAGALGKDTVLAKSLAVYAIKIEKFNSELRTLDVVLAAPLTVEGVRKKWVEQTFSSSSLYSSIKAEQQHIGTILETSYQWALDEAETRLETSHWRISVSRP